MSWSQLFLVVEYSKVEESSTINKQSRNYLCQFSSQIIKKKY